MNTIKIAGIKAPVPITHIMYVIGNGNYSDVYTDDGKRVLTSMTLSAIERQSADLIRIHKGALINPDFIKKVAFVESVRQRTLAPITMQDDTVLTVSRRRNNRLLSVKRLVA